MLVWESVQDEAGSKRDTAGRLNSKTGKPGDAQKAAAAGPAAAGAAPPAAAAGAKQLVRSNKE